MPSRPTPTPSHDPLQGGLFQLAAGASWLRLNLSTTAMGLALHPVSQSLQEYPEMASLLVEIHERLDVGADRRIQMFGRLGHGPRTSPSPRWPLDTRLRTQKNQTHPTQPFFAS